MVNPGNYIFEGGRARRNDSSHYLDHFVYKVVFLRSQLKRDLILSTELLVGESNKGKRLVSIETAEYAATNVKFVTQ